MLKQALFLATFVVIPLTGSPGVAAEDLPQESVTLLGMLFEWRYPESQFNGAQTSDAAVKDIGAIKSKAVLTTPDSVEKVMEFYRTKLNVDAEGKNLDEKEGERMTTDRSVLIQEVTDTPASKLYVIAINGTKSSTTLVVSRTERDDVTRIAWSNYRQLWP